MDVYSLYNSDRPVSQTGVRPSSKKIANVTTGSDVFSILNEKFTKLDRKFNDFDSFLHDKELAWVNERKELLSHISRLNNQTHDLNRRLSNLYNHLSSKSGKDQHQMLTEDLSGRRMFDLLNWDDNTQLARRIDLMEKLCGTDVKYAIELDPLEERAQVIPPEQTLTGRLRRLEEIVYGLIDDINAANTKKGAISNFFDNNEVIPRRTSPPRGRASRPRPATAAGGLYTTYKIFSPSPTRHPQPPQSARSSRGTPRGKAKPTVAKLNRVIQDVQAKLENVSVEVDTLHKDDRRNIQDLLSLSAQQQQKIFDLEANLSLMVDEVADAGGGSVQAAAMVAESAVQILDTPEKKTLLRYDHADTEQPPAADNTNTKLYELEHIVDSLATDFENVSSNVEFLSGRVNDAYGTMSGLTARVEEVSSSVERVSGKVEHVSSVANIATSRAEEIFGTVNEVTAKVERMSKSVDGVNGKVEQVSANVSGITSRVEQMSATVNGVTSRVEQMSATVSGVTSRAEEIFGTVYEVTSRVEQMSDRVDAVTTEVEQVSGAVKGVNAKVEEVSSTVNVVTSKIALMSGEMLGLDSKVEQISGSFIGVFSSVQQMSGTLNGVTAKVEHMSGSFNGVTAKVEHMSGSFNGVTAKVEHMSGTVHLITSKMEQISSSVSGVTARLDEMTGEISRLAAIVHSRGSFALGTDREKALGVPVVDQYVPQTSKLLPLSNSTTPEQASLQQQLQSHQYLKSPSQVQPQLQIPPQPQSPLQLQSHQYLMSPSQEQQQVQLQIQPQPQSPLQPQSYLQSQSAALRDPKLDVEYRVVSSNDHKTTYESRAGQVSAQPTTGHILSAVDDITQGNGIGIPHDVAQADVIRPQVDLPSAYLAVEHANEVHSLKKKLAELQQEMFKLQLGNVESLGVVESQREQLQKMLEESEDARQRMSLERAELQQRHKQQSQQLQSQITELQEVIIDLNRTHDNSMSLLVAQKEDLTRRLRMAEARELALEREKTEAFRQLEQQMKSASEKQEQVHILNSLVDLEGKARSHAETELAERVKEHGDVIMKGQEDIGALNARYAEMEAQWQKEKQSLTAELGNIRTLLEVAEQSSMRSSEAKIPRDDYVNRTAASKVETDAPPLVEDERNCSQLPSVTEVIQNTELGGPLSLSIELESKDAYEGAGELVSPRTAAHEGGGTRAGSGLRTPRAKEEESPWSQSGPGTITPWSPDRSASPRSRRTRYNVSSSPLRRSLPPTADSKLDATEAELSKLLRRFREQELSVQRFEQSKAAARLAIKTWALEFEATHGTAPSAADKRAVIEKYASHYEVRHHGIPITLLLLSIVPGWRKLTRSSGGVRSTVRGI